MTEKIQLFATTDLHGEFEDFTRAPMIKKLKTEAPNSIWIDNGDFFIGNPLTTYYNTNFEQSPLSKQANEFGYDVMIPGNHDFDYGLDFLEKQVEYLNMPYVCCNLFNLEDEFIFEPYTIIERNQKKIAIIGLMTQALPQLTAFENTQDIICKDTISSLKNVLEVLPLDTDLIIVAYHGGLEVDLISEESLHYKNTENQAYEIAKNFPEIDGFIAGHQHFVNAGKIDNCAFIQPGSHGKAVGSLTFNLNKNGWLNQAEVCPVDLPEKIENQAFNTWLGEEVDKDSIIEFLKEHFEIDKKQIYFKTNGNHRQDFLEAFSIPFSFYKYSFLKEEWAKITSDKYRHSNENKITIYTNDATLPSYRLMETYIDNIFDLYHKNLKKSSLK